ncbi:MAG: hypothetical protein DRJ52_00385 [Thermoprotei archaeon]|nr:MAG: hypothetical protein DRJ52_00385 [Thermoprotei archaeon]RLF00292.1 MAG: hypothetical protein DRJ63_02850 [Thermoprotei archaeon]HDI74943.1 hypothetical protein [Thermoprotei archaeon]
MYITLREALKDFLKEHDLTLDEVLDLMDEEDRDSLRASLLKRISITEKELRALEQNYTARQLNLLILAIQIFYLSNPSGLYKGRLIWPLRDEVVGEDGRISSQGLRLILKSLGLRPRWATTAL